MVDNISLPRERMNTISGQLKLNKNWNKGGEGLIKEMIIDNILVNVNATGEATYSGPINTPTLNSSGNSTFLVGGTLNIKALQTLGVYAGNYSVTVDYYW